MDDSRQQTGPARGNAIAVPNFPPYGYPIVSAQPETPDVREAPAAPALLGFPSRPQGTQSSLNRGRASISRGFRLSWSPCVIARGSAGRPGRHWRGLASFAPALSPSCIGAWDGSFSMGPAPALINPRTVGTDDRTRELEAEITRLSAQLEAARATAPHGDTRTLRTDRRRGPGGITRRSRRRRCRGPGRRCQNRRR